MSGSGNNEPPEWEHLNREALLALGLIRPSIIGPIVALLRSDAPIDPIVRNAIADAFEGKRPGGSPQFVVKGTGRGAHLGLSLEHFRRDVEIARYIVALRSGGHTLDDAADEAAKEFCVSGETCKRALKETRKMDKYYSSTVSKEFSDEVVASDNRNHPAISGYWATFVRRPDEEADR